MTITDTTPAPPGLRDMTDAELLELHRGDGETAAAALREAARRDYADRAARQRAGIRAEWYDAMFAQYLAAEAECRGNLLSREGLASGIADPISLWSGPHDQAMRFASWELRDFWAVHPRITVGEYERQRREAGRVARAEVRDAKDMEASDEELARDEPGALRRDETPAEAPQARPGRTVHSGGPGDSDAEGGSEDVRDGRPGRPVQRDGLEGAGAMTITQDAGPGEQPAAAEFTPGDMKHVLDETAEFVSKYVSCTRAQADTITLYATATNAIRISPAFGEILFTAKREQTGKTTAMTVAAHLCANPVSAKGTVAALQSELAAAANEPEKPAPVLYYDEIGGLYGESGLNRGSNWVLDDVLRDGYKNGATRKWSVNRSPQEFSIHVPVLMTGRGTSLPRDIRSRTIVVQMEPGTPGAYFDMREAQPEARALAGNLAQAVASRISGIEDFRAIGIHPKLCDRTLEVWEPLFAVAWILGGQEWLNRCLAAFRELVLAGSAQVALTPKQKVIRDAAEATAACDSKYVLHDGTEFMGGLILRDEMRRLDGQRPPGERRYQSKTDASLGQVIVDALPMSTVQVTVPDAGRKRGYYAADILAAWERIRPDDPEDVQIPEEIDPFEVAEEPGAQAVHGPIPA